MRVTKQWFGSWIFYFFLDLNLELSGTPPLPPGLHFPMMPLTDQTQRPPPVETSPWEIDVSMPAPWLSDDQGEGLLASHMMRLGLDGRAEDCGPHCEASLELGTHLPNSHRWSLLWNMLRDSPDDNQVPALVAKAHLPSINEELLSFSDLFPRPIKYIWQLRARPHSFSWSSSRFHPQWFYSDKILHFWLQGVPFFKSLCVEKLTKNQWIK